MLKTWLKVEISLHTYQGFQREKEAWLLYCWYLCCLSWLCSICWQKPFCCCHMILRKSLWGNDLVRVLKLGSKPLSGSKVESAFPHSEVNQKSTLIPGDFVIKSKLSQHCGSTTMWQLSHIHKKGVLIFFFFWWA